MLNKILAAYASLVFVICAQAATPPALPVERAEHVIAHYIDAGQFAGAVLEFGESRAWPHIAPSAALVALRAIIEPLRASRPTR